LITLIAQAQQSGTIASRLVWLPYGAATVLVQTIMNATDVTTGGNAIGVAILWTFDWVRVAHAASMTWQSGVYRTPLGDYGGGRPLTGPGLKMPIPPSARGFAGQLVVPQSLAIGLSMDIQDAHGNSLPIVAPSGAGVPVATPVWPVLHV